VEANSILTHDMQLAQAVFHSWIEEVAFVPPASRRATKPTPQSRNELCPPDAGRLCRL